MTIYNKIVIVARYFQYNFSIKSCLAGASVAGGVVYLGKLYKQNYLHDNRDEGSPIIISPVYKICLATALTLPLGISAIYYISKQYKYKQKQYQKLQEKHNNATLDKFNEQFKDQESPPFKVNTIRYLKRYDEHKSEIKIMLNHDLTNYLKNKALLTFPNNTMLPDAREAQYHIKLNVCAEMDKYIKKYFTQITGIVKDCNFDKLPTEMTDHIFSFLDLADVSLGGESSSS